MNDDPNSKQELAEGQAKRVQGDPREAWKEKAFRLTVARRFYCEGRDTAEIAAALNVDEAAVYNVLDSVQEGIGKR